MLPSQCCSQPTTYALCSSGGRDVVDVDIDIVVCIAEGAVMASAMMQLAQEENLHVTKLPRAGTSSRRWCNRRRSATAYTYNTHAHAHVSTRTSDTAAHRLAHLQRHSRRDEGSSRTRGVTASRRQCRPQSPLDEHWAGPRVAMTNMFLIVIVRHVIQASEETNSERQESSNK